MSARFSPGDAVRVRAGEPAGHCRTPHYLRGKRGRVVMLHGSYRNPEKLAYLKPGLPRQPLYMIEFDYAEVWAGRQSGRRDRIVADIYQHWLEADPAR